MLLLRECQQNKVIQLGPMGNLDVVTGIEVINYVVCYMTYNRNREWVR